MCFFLHVNIFCFFYTKFLHCCFLTLVLLYLFYSGYLYKFVITNIYYFNSGIYITILNVTG